MTSPKIEPKLNIPPPNASDDPNGFSANPCPGSCHSTPKAPALKPSTWFFENQKNNPELTLDILRKFAKKPDDKSPVASPPPATTATPSPETEKLLQSAVKAEKAAGLAASPELKLAQYQDALGSYKLAQDSDGYKRVLGLMRKEYEKLGQDVAMTKVDAELNFIDGKFEDSLKSYRGLEALLWSPKLKLSPDERKAALYEANLKISLTLQALGSSLTKDKNYAEALPYLEEALQRTPSELLTAKVIEAQVASKQADLGYLKGRIAKLQNDIMSLKTPSTCNSGCHSSPKPDPFAGYDAKTKFPFELDAQGNLVPKKLEEEPSDPRVHQSPAYLRPQSFEELQLRHLSAFDRERLKFMEQELVNLQGDLATAKQRIKDTVHTGMAAYNEGDKLFARELYLADVMQKAGDPEAAVEVYQDLLKTLSGPGNELKRGAVQNQMASVHFNAALHELNTRQVWTLDFEQAIKALDAGEADLKSAPASPQRDFLLMQNRFMKAEVMLSKAHTTEEAAAGKAVLEKAYLDGQGNIPEGDPRRALLGRIRLRLAQWHFNQSEPTSRNMGEHYVSEILRENKGDVYLESQAKLARGLSTLRAPGKSIEGLQQLRQLQLDYPGSEADKILRQSDTIANLRDKDGVIKAKISEGDFGEALKVALDRSSEGSGLRKGVFAAGGALVALLFWEVSIPVILLGGGAGYFAEKGVSVAEHKDDIADAYASGISNVDMNRHVTNLFMLGLDVAMLVTAGAGGAVARQGTKALLSLGARELAPLAAPIAEDMGRFAFGALALRGLAQAGKGAMYLIPAAVDSTVAYTIYKGERSLLLGEKFEWDAKEALLMFAMCESFAMAHRLGIGSKWAAQSAKAEITPVLTNGKLSGFRDAGGQELKAVLKDGKVSHFENAAGKKYSPVYHEGKMIGATDTAGRLVGWGTDVVVGATGYYGLLLGIQATGSEVPGGIPSYDAFLADQLKTLGALHLGSKVANKIGNGALDNALLKLDRRSNEWLKQAKERIDQGGDSGGGWGGLVPAYAGIGGTPRIGRVTPDGKFSKGPTILMMSNNGDGNKFWQDLEDFELTLLEKDIDVSPESKKQPIKENENVPIKIDLKSVADLDVVAEGLQTKLPKQLQKITLTLDHQPTAQEMVKLAKASKNVYIEILTVNAKGERVIGAEIVEGSLRIHSDQMPSIATLKEWQKISSKDGMAITAEKTVQGEKRAYHVEVVGDQVRVPDLKQAGDLLAEALRSKTDIKIYNDGGKREIMKLEGDKVILDFKSESVERLELLQNLTSQALNEGRDLTIISTKSSEIAIKASGPSKKVSIAGTGTLLYSPGAKNMRSKLVVDILASANSEAAALLIGSAANLKPAQLEGALVSVIGAPAVEASGSFRPIRQSLGLLVQKSLWGKVSELQVGKNKDIFLSSAGKHSGVQYSFETKLPIEVANPIFSEYLAFEAASALGLKGPQSADYATLLAHFRSAMNQAVKLEANARPERKAEYQPYVADGRSTWTNVWTQSVESMVRFAKDPAQAIQLLDTLNMVRDYSQVEKGSFLGFAAFDGRAYSDNSFELARIFEYAKTDSRVDLEKVLSTIHTVLGKSGSVSLYGAGVGIVFKARVPNKMGYRNVLEVDKAAVNELDNLIQMKKELIMSGEPYRLNVIPEDRLQGSNYRTNDFTKTPEWVVEKLGADGSVQKVVTVEVTEMDGSLATFPEVSTMIDKKTDQVLRHQFSKEQSQKDALISIRFYRPGMRDTDLLRAVQDALQAKYNNNRNRDIRAGLEKTRVKVTMSDGPTETTYWLEYKGGSWNKRSFEGANSASGTAWPEALPQALSW